MDYFLQNFIYVGIIARPIYVGIALWGLWLGLRRTDLPPQRQRRFFLAVSLPLIVWFAAVWYFAYGNGFVPSTPGKGSPLVPIAIFLPVIAWFAVLRRSNTMAAVLDAIPPSWLIGIQVYRVLGAAFLAQWMLGNAPAAFAIPAGLGDVIVGVLAPIAAIAVSGSSRNKWAGYAWNALGILDLVSAVSLGTLNGAGMLPPAANSLAPPLGAYPLVMVAAYTVPLSFVLHFLSVWQLKRRTLSAGARITAPVPEKRLAVQR